MDGKSFSKKPVSLDATIDVLELTKRIGHCLGRAYIFTVRDLINVLNEGPLNVRGIGPLGESEIRTRLEEFSFVDNGVKQLEFKETARNEIKTLEIEVIKEVISSEVINWQVFLIKKQMALGLLRSSAFIYGKTIDYWISNRQAFESRKIFNIFSHVIGGGVTVYDEIDYILGELPEHYIKILIGRYGIDGKTLETIGNELNLTRERIRQISNRIEQRVEGLIDLIHAKNYFENLVTTPSLVRIQTALLLASDQGLNLTFHDWQNTLYTSGLIGNSSHEHLNKVGALEIIVALCNLLRAKNYQELILPSNLSYTLELTKIGRKDLPAKVEYTLRNLPKETEKSIKRHYYFSGAVYAKWIAEELGKSEEQTVDLLRALDFRKIANNWYIPSHIEVKTGNLGKLDSFHRAIRKMSQFCGPLSVDDICSGLRNAISRAKPSYPVPPILIMQQILPLYGYSFEDGLYYWDGQTNEVLSSGEQIILGCIKKNGPVVHHTELAQAFIDSELSFPSLHATLNRSPLFKKIKVGLYKLRGAKIAQQDIQRAETANERVPVDMDIQYGMDGTVTIYANLGILAIGTGNLFSDQLPNMAGEWRCSVKEKELGTLIATKNEIKRLEKAFELLSCQVGDRIQLTFDNWKRSVTIKKV